MIYFYHLILRFLFVLLFLFCFSHFFRLVVFLNSIFFFSFTNPKLESAPVWTGCPQCLKHSSPTRLSLHHHPRDSLVLSCAGFPVSCAPSPSFLVYSLICNRHILHQLSGNRHTRGKLFHTLYVWNCHYSTLTLSLATNRIIDCKLVSFIILKALLHWHLAPSVAVKKFKAIPIPDLRM